MPILRFGVFEVDPDSGELRKRGFRIRLREQPLRLLLTLIDQAGRVVTREQLRHRLWPKGTFVDFDRAINKAASEVRFDTGRENEGIPEGRSSPLEFMQRLAALAVHPRRRCRRTATGRRKGVPPVIPK